MHLHADVGKPTFCLVLRETRRSEVAAHKQPHACPYCPLSPPD